MGATLLRWLRDDRRGALIVEFVFVLPILVTLAAGGFEVVRLAIIHQKMDRTAMSAADLTSRVQSISEDMITDVFEAARATMEPYEIGTEGTVIVTNISVDGANPAQVNWQRRTAGGPSEVSKFGEEGDDAALPAGFTLEDGESVIIAEVFFDYEPLMFAEFAAGNTLYHRAFFRPRLSDLSSIEP